MIWLFRFVTCDLFPCWFGFMLVGLFDLFGRLGVYFIILFICCFVCCVLLMWGG